MTKSEDAKLPKSVKDELVVTGHGLPPILAGHSTDVVEMQVRSFYEGVASMFEAWLARRKSPHTRRAYRRDVMDFVDFMGIWWPQDQSTGPDESWKLLQATVPDVQAWRDFMDDERNLAPNTLNRRLSSLAGFFRFMRESAAELRLPITVPNPAHSQFVGREAQAPVTPTEALSATRARQLVSLPEGEEVLAYRDRALLKFYLYSSALVKSCSQRALQP